MKKKEYLKKFFLCWESVFLFIFMIGIFGPSEVFFGNYTDGSLTVEYLKKLSQVA